MNISEMHIAFEIGVDKIDSDSVPNILSSEIDFFLNQSQDQFVKTRYSGNNIYGTAFEQTQKRTDDLRTIVKRQLVPFFPYTTEDNVYYGTIPADYDFLTNLRVRTISAECGYSFIDTSEYHGTTIMKQTSRGFYTLGREVNEYSGYYADIDDLVTLVPGSVVTGTLVPNIVHKWVGGKEIQHDDLSEYLTDPFNKPNPEKPLYLFEVDDMLMYANEDFIVSFVEMTYIRKLARLSSATPLPTGAVVACELPSHTHQEIVDIAVNNALENIESPRIATHGVIMSKQE